MWSQKINHGLKMARKARAKLEEVEQPNIYFLPENKLEFVSTGCTVLDCALGNGYPLGRIVNIVGDRSTAKTLLGSEAVINFIRQYPDGAAFYRETEASYDANYAKQLGMPVDKVEFGDPDKPITTVEEFAKELAEFIKRQTTSGKPGIYVLDSLDALSDDAEMERDIGEGTFGMAKAKAMSILFRTVARKLERTKILLIVISQVRENIGVQFGERYRRSGGKALDFYSSITLWLSKVKDLDRTIKKIKRIYGVLVKGKVKKNKVSMPFRECNFEVHFGYGIEDFLASISWLEEVDRLPKEFSTIEYEKLSDHEYRDLTNRAGRTVKEAWFEIEQTFLPKRSKYSNEDST
jgi:recombination protein RecA